MSLILTRRPNQSVIITTPSGEQVKVFIAGITNGICRLGFDTENRDIIIDREEIALVKQADREAAKQHNK
ncbi:carbon storage regulator [Moritella viscosa]|uniref:Global regulator protein n=1 Tax=Moritella viscosa TaxID=80854 RepID=A0A1L0AR04_9GAMM|nr:carbon storage regulator [Moritella viscosa]SGZ17401.1 Global regulator protein [Moritella viscosa]